MIREILVRRMRMRRDLEDIAEELRVSGHSCRRQVRSSPGWSTSLESGC